MFFILYSQKLTNFDIFGSLMIVLSVVLIGFGGSGGSGSKTDSMNLILSVIFAMLTGFMFTVSALNINYIMKNIKFPTSQLNYDGAIVYAAFLAPFFIYDMALFTMKDIVYANASQISNIVATIFVSYAL